jgi:hypothetical protein
MSQTKKIVFSLVVVLLALAGAHGQSLGDVARAQRQKQAKNVASHKVLTNEDIPESTEPASPSPSCYEEHGSTSPAPASNDTHAAEQWKARIEAQKSSVAALQSQIDRVNSSIHFTSGNCVANCVQHNERQIQKQEEVERMQKQLDEKKKELEDMQESARKAGLGSAVYEP